jgi:hypothetical protein
VLDRTPAGRFLDGFRRSSFGFTIAGRRFPAAVPHDLHSTALAPAVPATADKRKQSCPTWRCLPLEQGFFHQWLPLSLRRPELSFGYSKVESQKRLPDCPGNEGSTQRSSPSEVCILLARPPVICAPCSQSAHFHVRPARRYSAPPYPQL